MNFALDKMAKKHTLFISLIILECIIIFLAVIYFANYSKNQEKLEMTITGEENVYLCISFNGEKPICVLKGDSITFPRNIDNIDIEILSIDEFNYKNYFKLYGGTNW